MIGAAFQYLPENSDGEHEYVVGNLESILTAPDHPVSYRIQKDDT